MAEHEFYHLDLVVGAKGIEETETRLRAMDRFLEQTRKQAELMKRVTASPAVRLDDRVSSPARKITSTMQTLSSRKWSVTIGLVDKVTAAAGSAAKRAASTIRSAVGSAASTAFSLPAIVAGSAATYAGVIAPLKATGDMEQANIAFTTMLKSADKAKSFISDLQVFAERTPFDFSGVRDAAQRMLAFKFKPEDIIPDLTTIGDWAGAMGKGKEGIDRVVLAFGQMKAKGRVQGDEMLQLTEAGINGYDYLSKAMGVTTAQVMKLQEKGLVPANQAIEAIMKGMKEDFGGSMKAQEKTLFGLKNRITETFSNKFLLRWGDGLSKGIMPKLEQVGNWLDNNEATVTRWGEKFYNTAETVSTHILNGFDDAFGYVNKHYLQNPSFQNLSLQGKISFVVDDAFDAFNKWYDGGGDKQINAVSSKLVNNLADAITNNASTITDAGVKLGGSLAGGILEGAGKSLKNVNKEAIENPSPSSILTAGATNMVVGAIGYSVLRKSGKLVKPLLSLGKRAPKIGKTAETVTSTAAHTVTESAAKMTEAVKPIEILGADGKVISKVLPAVPEVSVAKAATETAAKASQVSRVGKTVLRGSKTVGKVAVPLGVGLDVLDIATSAPGRERNAAIGGSLGGWGGVAAGGAAGAAIGSVVPILGTTVGGIIGGIIGGWGGDFLGRKVGSNIPASKEKTLIRQEPIRPSSIMFHPVPSASSDQVLDSLKNIKQENKIQYTFNMPPGAVQVQVNKDEINETELMNKVGIPFVKNLTKILQNQQP